MGWKVEMWLPGVGGGAIEEGLVQDRVSAIKRSKAWGSNVKHGDHIVDNTGLYNWNLLRE